MDAIMCIDQEYGYAKNGYIPWSFKSDMVWFQSMTRDKVLYVGHNTYPEVARLHGVLGRTLIKADYGASTFIYKEDYQRSPHNYMCIGGGKLLQELIESEFIERLWVTKIHRDYDCDQNIAWLQEYMHIRQCIGDMKEDGALLERFFIDFF